MSESRIAATFQADHRRVTYAVRIYSDSKIGPVQLTISTGGAYVADYLSVDELRAFAAQLVAAADSCDVPADLPITGA